VTNIETMQRVASVLARTPRQLTVPWRTTEPRAGGGPRGHAGERRFCAPLLRAPPVDGPGESDPEREEDQRDDEERRRRGEVAGSVGLDHREGRVVAYSTTVSVGGGSRGGRRGRAPEARLWSAGHRPALHRAHDRRRPLRVSRVRRRGRRAPWNPIADQGLTRRPQPLSAAELGFQRVSRTMPS
jgi:hypothetical protein